MAQIKEKPLTVKEFVALMIGNMKDGNIKPTDKLYISSDEEGNSFSPVVFEGVTHNGENRVVLYPLFPKLPEDDEELQ